MSGESGSHTEVSFRKLRELDAHFDRQLEAYSDSGGKKDHEPGAPQKKFSIRKWFGRLTVLFLFLLFPFFLLIRISLLGYSHYQLNGWIALLAGVTATVILLLLYSVLISFKISGKAKVHRYMVRGITGLVLAYCCYALLYLSSYHVKSEEIRTYYRSLHPILRVTITTASLADPGLIITDMQRNPEDYREMGLTVRQKSLHYEQETGYVHAVDLRTVGKAEWKNGLTRQFMNLLGFRTIRHVGTADHLHVALPLNDW